MQVQGTPRTNPPLNPLLFMPTIIGTTVTLLTGSVLWSTGKLSATGAAVTGASTGATAAVVTGGIAKCVHALTDDKLPSQAKSLLLISGLNDIAFGGIGVGTTLLVYRTFS